MSHERLRRLDLNLLFVFEALLRTGGVTRAAETLDVTQSAVSHALANLRNYFGDPLFVRSREGVSPTQKAQMLAPAVFQITALSRDALFPEAWFDPLTAERVITLCVNDLGELVTMPLLIERLRQAAPRCTVQTVQMIGPELETALENGSVDLALAGPLNFSGDILQQKLYTQNFVVLANAASPLKSPISLAEFQEAEQVVVIPSRVDLLPVNSALQELGVARKAYLTTPHTLVLPAIIRQNPSLISIIPRIVSESFGAIEGLKVLETAFELPSFPIAQFWHRRFGADTFNVWLRSQMRDLFYKNRGFDIT
jgi:DNA-binding transcriptional LysR family regulator